MDITFTNADIEELADIVEFSSNSSIDGKPITCFPMLHSLVLGNTILTDYSKNEINDAIEQVLLEKEFLQSLGNFDCTLHDKLLKYLRD